MSERKDMQQLYKYAVNGRLLLLVTGILMIISAVISNIANGIAYFMVANDAAKGVQEAVDMLAEAQMPVSVLRIAAIVMLVTGVMEFAIGFLSARLSNRVKVSGFTFKIAIVLVVWELVSQGYLFYTRMVSPFSALSSIIVAGFMVWGAISMKKLHEADPERVFAVEKAKAGKKNASAAPKASLSERANLVQSVKDENEGEETDR